MKQEGEKAGLLPAVAVDAAAQRHNGLCLSQFVSRKPVHAYLLSGPRGVGKFTFARMLTAALFCTGDHKPCGVCDECRRVWTDTQPDVTILRSEDKTISVDRVREILQTISQRAFGSGFKAVLVEPVEKMTAQAQNCLLKSLEEPPEQVVFLLMTHEPSTLLPTITSRCARVKLAPWADERLSDTLLGMGYPLADVQRVLPLCCGIIGQALAELAPDGRDENVERFVRQALEMNTDADAVRLSTQLKDEKEGAERYLGALETVLHRVLLARTGQTQPPPNLPALWAMAAQSAPVGALAELLQAIFDARKLRAGQVNWQSTIDHLMMRILEDNQAWRQSLA